MAYALELSDQEVARYRLMAERAREQEAELWQLAGLVPGASVVDVGCGPGAMLAVLADVVGGAGRVVGVDADPGAVAAARAAVGEAGGAAHVAQADATGLAPGSFDVAVLRHVLAHNGGREQAIVDHLASLVRPGGSVYLVDIDASTGSLTPDHPDLVDLTERYQRWHSLRGNDLLVGRRLPELARGAGLDVLRHDQLSNRVALPPGQRGPAWAARDALVDAGVATADDVRRWEAAHHEVDAWADRPVVTMTVWAAVARRDADRG